MAVYLVVYGVITQNGGLRGLRSTLLPDSVEKICEKCFAKYHDLSHSTFGRFSLTIMKKWPLCVMPQSRTPEVVKALRQ